MTMTCGLIPRTSGQALYQTVTWRSCSMMARVRICVIMTISGLSSASLRVHHAYPAAPIATAMITAMRSFSMNPPAAWVSGHFEQSRSAHATADAHRDHDPFRAAPLALDERMARQARARHSIGMPERDGAAI